MSTEQDRELFEAWAFADTMNRDERDSDGKYQQLKMQWMWQAWQAARRAPVVPQQYSDWRIDSTAGCDILVYKDCSVIEDGQAHWVLSIIRAALAAAPQPPEAFQTEDGLMRENPATRTEAAPVQLPEPAGWIDDGGKVFWNDGRKPNDGEIIYTEHQVRQLLATAKESQ